MEPQDERARPVALDADHHAGVPRVKLVVQRDGVDLAHSPDRV
jgi:hypothetical protein